MTDENLEPDDSDETGSGEPCFRGPYGAILPDPVPPRDRLKYGSGGPLAWWPTD